MRPAVVLFARSPEREASAKRMRFAAPLFRALVAAWLDAARRHDATPIIACDETDQDALAGVAPQLARQWITQRGDSFGDRAAHAVDDAFARGFDAVLIAAIDAPPHHLGEAFRRLAEGTPVVSPSRDGGVNFIGFTEPAAELLRDIEIGRHDLVSLFAHFHVITSTIDLDGPCALAIARTDRAWRSYFPSAPAAQPRNHATALQVLVLPCATRAPPRVV